MSRIYFYDPKRLLFNNVPFLHWIWYVVFKRFGMEFRRFGGQVHEPLFNYFYIRSDARYMLEIWFECQNESIFYDVEF